MSFHKNIKITKNILGIGGRYSLPEKINDICRFFITYWDLKNIFYRRPLNLISLSGGNCAFWKQGLMQERKKRELLYCSKRVGGDDTIMCYELEKFGRLIYDPDISVVHKKRCSLLNILNETINLGYSGAIVAGVCGRRLLKEPHRFYKSILYVLSLSVFLSTLFLPFTKDWIFYFSLLGFYIVIQLPIIFLMPRHLSNPASWLFLPIVIFISDMLHSIGHLKRGRDITRRAVSSFIWYTKLLLNAINPSLLSRFFFFVTKRCNSTCYFFFYKHV